MSGFFGAEIRGESPVETAVNALKGDAWTREEFVAGLRNVGVPGKTQQLFNHCSEEALQGAALQVFGMKPQEFQQLYAANSKVG